MIEPYWVVLPRHPGPRICRTPYARRLLWKDFQLTRCSANPPIIFERSRAPLDRYPLCRHTCRCRCAITRALGCARWRRAASLHPPCLEKDGDCVEQSCAVGGRKRKKNDAQFCDTVSSELAKSVERIAPRNLKGNEARRGTLSIYFKSPALALSSPPLATVPFVTAALVSLAATARSRQHSATTASLRNHHTLRAARTHLHETLPAGLKLTPALKRTLLPRVECWLAPSCHRRGAMPAAQGKAGPRVPRALAN